MCCRATFLCGLATILVSVVLASDEGILQQYNKRQLVILKLNSTYDQYRATYPQHKEERARLLNLFMGIFNDHFDSSDEWILENMASDDGIIEKFTQLNGFDYVKTKAFLETVPNVFMGAGLQRIRYEIHLGNYSEAERLEGAIDEGLTELQKQSNATLNYIRTTAYKLQFKTDVNNAVKYNGRRIMLPDIVVKQLAKKFPFRSWVAILIDPSMEHKFCNSGDVFTVSAYSRQLMVFDVPASTKSNSKLATNLLNRVDNSVAAGFHSCENRANSILFKEAKYQCNQKSFYMAGVTKVNGGLPRIVSSNHQLNISKDVWRARLSFICQAYFRIFFLA